MLLAAPERARVVAEVPEDERELEDLHGQARAHGRLNPEHPQAIRSVKSRAKLRTLIDAVSAMDALSARRLDCRVMASSTRRRCSLRAFVT